MTERQPIVFIVDDDGTTRRFFEAVLSDARVETRSFESASEFLQVYDAAQPGCLLLDVQMPDMSGPELQQHLNLRDAVLPVVFISGNADIPIAVRAMSAGAFDFLQKPLSHAALLRCVRRALEYDAANRTALQERDQIMERFNSLTTRERAVLSLLISGLSNKAMAADLRLSQRTVELYRARVMEKTGSRSLAQLIRMSMNLDFARAQSARASSS